MEKWSSTWQMTRSAAFRVDASLNIGTGHVMRCLTLAAELTLQGYQILFICRPHSGNLIDKIKSCGYKVEILPTTSATTTQDPRSWLGATQREDAEQTAALLLGQKFDWLIIDHYAIDSEWEARLRDLSNRILVIDDLADRSHTCDLLLDQNLGRKSSDYQGLVPSDCQLLIGPEYALLRPEFRMLRANSLYRRNKADLRRWIISLGGVDALDYTSEVLRAMQQASLNPESEITIVLGRHAPHLQRVRQLVAQMPWPTRLCVDVENMAALMAESDIAVGAAGSSSWERACLGLPTLMLTLAENQSVVAKNIELSGAAHLIDTRSLPQSFLTAVIQIKESATELRDMSVRSSNLTEGLGLNLVVQAMMTLKGDIKHLPDSCVLRLLQEYDLEQIRLWRNHPSIRLNMFTQHEISPSEHIAWWKTTALDPTRACYLFSYSNIPLGVVTLSDIDRSEGTATWGFYVAPDAKEGSGLLLGVTAMRHFFTISGLRLIRSAVLETNQVSRKFHERLGFEEIPINASASAKNSTLDRLNVVHYSLSKEKWLEHNRKLQFRIIEVTRGHEAHYLQ